MLAGIKKYAIIIIAHIFLLDSISLKNIFKTMKHIKTLEI